MKGVTCDEDTMVVQNKDRTVGICFDVAFRGAHGGEGFGVGGIHTSPFTIADHCGVWYFRFYSWGSITG